MRKKERKEKIYKKRYVIMATVRRTFLFTFAVIPAIIFPQFKPIEATGNLAIKTVSYTWSDTSRKEIYSDQGVDRKVTVQFWYPDNTDNNEKYPLLVFSHGSFGFRGSNLSTFENLVSRGYVVCSIDHTNYAFFTKQTDGSMVLADMEFINNAMAVENGEYDELKTYQLTQEWLNYRLADANFVLDEILDRVKRNNVDEVYQTINSDKIGLFGHSIGGAMAAELGRDREDIDAAIVVDGTMLGEEIDFEDGKAVLNSEPYPIPLLNIYNEEHYREAAKEGNTYPNTAAALNAVDAKDVVVKGSGHLNFTDLPMFSPFLAGLLGTGEVDSRYCIETMNQVILDYFDYYLKDAKELNLRADY
jgi:dienelactone hydrolase